MNPKFTIYCNLIVLINKVDLLDRFEHFQDGWLYHKDIKNIWEKFSPSLHDWLLKLTEEFDLSFPLIDQDEQKANIVPCLLPVEPANVCR